MNKKEGIEMKKIFEMGKIAYHKKNATNRVTIEVELKDTKKGEVFSASGKVWTESGSDIVMGGQCLDELAQYESISNNETFKLIYDMWEKHHLNNLHAGTVEQEEALEKAVIDGNLSSYNASSYKECCEYLKSIGLYEVEYKGQPFKYGYGWLFREIPQEDLKKIEALLKK